MLGGSSVGTCIDISESNRRTVAAQWPIPRRLLRGLRGHGLRDLSSEVVASEGDDLDVGCQ